MKVILSLVLIVGLLVPVAASAQDSGMAVELQRIRRDLSDLQSYVYSGDKQPRRPKAAGAPSRSGEPEAVSRMQVQMQGLESQIRDLTGRVEKAEFGVTSLTDRFERLANDIEVRFQALEQGVPGAGSVSPLPRGSSAKGGPTGQFNLGTLPGSGSGNPQTAPGRVGSAMPATAKGQYDLAFDQLRKGAYDDAAAGFKKFSEVHPNHALASNALFWHGETYYVRKNYADAARIFLNGYKRYPKGNKAPDSLFKLGRSLALINEKKSACAALRKMLKAFPNANPRLKRSTKKEIKNLRCS